MADLYDAGTKKKKKEKGIFDWLEEMKDEAVASSNDTETGGLSLIDKETVRKAKERIKKRKKEEAED